MKKWYDTRFGDIRPTIKYYFIIGVTFLTAYLGGIIYDKITWQSHIKEPTNTEQTIGQNKLEHLILEKKRIIIFLLRF